MHYFTIVRTPTNNLHRGTLIKGWWDCKIYAIDIDSSPTQFVQAHLLFEIIQHPPGLDEITLGIVRASGGEGIVRLHIAI